MKKLGLDVGSTTLKAVLTDEKNDVVFAVYKRHFSKISDTVLEILRQIDQQYPQLKVSVTLSGSAGLGVADALDLPFVQEVYAEKSAIEALCPNADVAIELGGEDAKILFLSGGFEMRMNGSCAGGTGAFIDQMATLMQLDADNLNQLAKNHQKGVPNRFALRGFCKIGRTTANKPRRKTRRRCGGHISSRRIANGCGACARARN